MPAPVSLRSDGVATDFLFGSLDGVTEVALGSHGIGHCTISPSGILLASVESDGITTIVIDPGGHLVAHIESAGVSECFVVVSKPLFTDPLLGDVRPVGMALDFRGNCFVIPPPLDLL